MDTVNNAVEAAKEINLILVGTHWRILLTEP